MDTISIDPYTKIKSLKFSVLNNTACKVAFTHQMHTAVHGCAVSQKILHTSQKVNELCASYAHQKPINLSSQ